jgi:hypothetical protein
MAPLENGYVSCYNYHDRPDVSHLPHPVDLWRKFLGYVIGPVFEFGEWVWVYKHIFISHYGIRSGAKGCDIIPFFIRRLAHARGRHWDRKRR